jgi:2-amino-4-hydroxy-6-hydroxymethyldihydropteridine diphosphokinase
VSPRPEAIVVGLGGNVGDVAAIVARMVLAREALGVLGAVRSAPLYRTAPIGPAQAPFLNTAIRIAAEDVTPAELVALVLETERLLGRDRRAEARWGPRPIDLDVLLWGARRVRWDGPPPLEVPHPRLAERRFVLAPLRALLGDDATVPGVVGTLATLEAAVRDQAIEELRAIW